jgi:hypothetical protein
MNDLSSCINRITQEIRLLQELLQFSTFQNSGPGTQNRVLHDLVDIGFIHNLKSAVDHMRHFLWNYLESISAAPQAGNTLAIQSSRLDQITDLLCLLHHSSLPLYASSFIDRMTSSVNELLEKSDSPKTLVKQAAA